MTWNWQQKGWPDFTFDAALLEPLELQYAQAVGAMTGTMKHLALDDRDELVVSMLGTKMAMGVWQGLSRKNRYPNRQGRRRSAAFPGKSRRTSRGTTMRWHGTIRISTSRICSAISRKPPSKRARMRSGP